MPRIAHVISTPQGSGGAEQVLAAIIRGGQERNWDQMVLNPMATHRQGSAMHELCAGEPYEGYLRPGLRGAMNVRRWLARRLDGFAPNIVHAHLMHALVLVASLPARPGRASVLTHHHGNHFEALGARGRELADRLGGRRFDRVVAVSPFVADHLRHRYGYASEAVVTICNGWSGRPVDRRPSEAPTIVCVANFRHQKGHRFLLEAFKQVVDRMPSARLKLVGDGELRGALERQARHLGIDGAVDFTGPVDDIWPLLAEAHVFVLPSLYEPFGLVIVEAMAAGVPVVATAVGGVTGLVQADEDGLLVRAGHERDLARGILRVLSDPGLAARLAAAGRLTAEGFHIDLTVERYFALYTALLSDHNA